MAEIKIAADSGGGSVGLKGPASTTSNAAVQLTLPVDDGTASQYLQTNGSGVLSWATVSSTPEGTAIKSTGETGTTKFLRVDGDNTCSWQIPAKSITHINQWHIPSNTSGSGSNDLTAWNKSADSLSDYALLGSEMSHSSGIFTFPATGMWLIFFSAWYYADARSSRWFQCRIMTTTNNNTYNQVADCSNAIYDTGSNGYNSCAAMVVFDVTDTSNCKVKFQYDAQNTLEVMGGKNFTSTRFIKIAET